jgi:hypothetical protein
MGEMPKRVKHALREVAMRAHEEELRRAIVPLAEAFEQWRAGKVSSGELVDLIHNFHQGPAKPPTMACLPVRAHFLVRPQLLTRV